MNFRIIENASILVIGDNTADKTWLVHQLIDKMMSENNITKVAIITSNTKKYNDYKRYIINDADTFICNQVSKYSRNHLHIKSLVVVDSEDNSIYRGRVRELVFNGRHYSCAVIYVRSNDGLMKDMMSNLDYIFITRLRNITKGVNIAKFYGTENEYKQICYNNSIKVITNNGMKTHTRYKCFEYNYDLRLIGLTKKLKSIMLDIRCTFT